MNNLITLRGLRDEASLIRVAQGGDYERGINDTVDKVHAFLDAAEGNDFLPRIFNHNSVQDSNRYIQACRKRERGWVLMSLTGSGCAVYRGMPITSEMSDYYADWVVTGWSSRREQVFLACDDAHVAVAAWVVDMTWDRSPGSQS